MTSKQIEELHAAISSNNVHEVKDIAISSIGKLAVYQNESALAAALKNKKFIVYEILVKNSFVLHEDEDFENIIKDFDADKKKLICKIHVDNSVKNYPEILKSKCELKHATQEEKHQIYFGHIYESLQRLTNIQWMSLILQTITFADELKIIFDFDHDSVNHIDPRTYSSTKGICYYFIGEIFIGAKGLFDGNNKPIDDNKPINQVCTVMGVIAHEFCHFAAQLLYDNDAKPYRKNDLKRAEEFKNVLEKCKAKKDKEEIIRLVFDCYPKESQHAELIVRVVHILAVYSLDEHREKLQQLKQTFHELFDFFQENFAADLKRELPMIEAKLKIKDANEACGLFETFDAYNLPFELENFKTMKLGTKSDERVQILISNWIDATLKGIFTKFEMNNQLEGKIFMKLETFEIDQTAEKILKALRKYDDATIVVQCDINNCSKIEEKKQIIADNNSNTRMIFVIPKEANFTSSDAKEVVHSWSQLTDDSKEIFLSKQVNFQGFKVKLSDFAIKDSDMIKLINLNDLHTGNEITIGNEVKFEDVEIYIERTFNLSSSSDYQLKIEDFLFKNGTRKMLLIAEPGNGKSTELKQIAMKLKFIYPCHWICYIDLKKHTTVFQKDGKVGMTFNDPNEISEYFSEKVLMLQGFERSFFVELFNKNHVIFLFDGVDEICPSFKEFVLKLMAGIDTKSQNFLIVASRPHLTEILEKTLQTEAFKLLAFTLENRNHFFEQFFGLHKNKKSKSENIKKCEEIVKLTNRCRNPVTLVLNPLLLHMIASLVFENEDFEPLTANLYSIYNKFTLKHIARIAGKGPDAVQDLAKIVRNARIIRYHQRKAVENVFKGNEQLTAPILADNQDIPVDQLARIGLMYAGGDGNLYFHHITFAEFFVAEFLLEEVLEPNETENAVVQLLWIVIKNREYSMVRKFLDDKLEGFEFDKFNSLNKNNIWIGGTAMYYSAIEGCVNLIKFWSVSLAQGNQETFQLWFNNKILLSAAEFHSLATIKDLWDFADEIFDAEQMRNLLTSKADCGQNVLSYSIRRDSEEIFEFFQAKIQELLSEERFEKERKHLLNPKRLLFEVVKKKKKYIEIKPSLVLSRMRKILTDEELRPCMLLVGEKDKTILHFVFREPESEHLTAAVEIVKRVLSPSEIEQMMSQKDKNFWSPLMIATLRKNVSDFQLAWNLCEKRHLLLQHDHNGWNVLHLSAKNSYTSEIFEFAVKLYTDKFSRKKVKEILGVEFNDHENILHKTCMSKSFATVFDYMENLFGKTELIKMLIKGRDYSQDGHLFFLPLNENLEVIESFVLRNCVDDVPTNIFHFWFYLSAHSSFEFIEKLTLVVDGWPKSAVFYKKIFSFKNAANKTLLEYARDNEDKRIYDFFFLKKTTTK